MAVYLVCVCKQRVLPSAYYVFCKRSGRRWGHCKCTFLFFFFFFFFLFFFSGKKEETQNRCVYGESCWKQHCQNARKIPAKSLSSPHLTPSFSSARPFPRSLQIKKGALFFQRWHPSVPLKGYQREINFRLPGREGGDERRASERDKQGEREDDRGGKGRSVYSGTGGRARDERKRRESGEKRSGGQPAIYHQPHFTLPYLMTAYFRRVMWEFELWLQSRNFHRFWRGNGSQITAECNCRAFLSRFVWQC